MSFENHNSSIPPEKMNQIIADQRHYNLINFLDLRIKQKNPSSDQHLIAILEHLKSCTEKEFQFLQQLKKADTEPNVVTLQELYKEAQAQTDLYRTLLQEEYPEEEHALLFAINDDSNN